MPEIIFHVDVNSAYLSWSAIRRLENGDTLDLRLIPSIIGGDQTNRRGVVLAKSIPAKVYGIVTGEPVVSALRKCPSLVLEPPDHQFYDECSHRLMEFLYTYTSDVEQLSVDECFLDFGPIAHRYSSAQEAAQQIKDSIREKLGFTVNIGIAPNRLLAKMASDFQKPDRIHTLFPEEIPVKMWPLPVRDLYMVGQASAKRLELLGLRTIGDLAAADVGFLTSHFKSHGRQMWEYANGIGSARVDSEQAAVKGIGNSTTLKEDADTPEKAKKVFLELAETVSRRLRRANKFAGSISIEIKYHTFDTRSHQTTLPAASHTTQTLYMFACQLFDELWDGRPIRLLGIRTAKLTEENTPVQLSLFDLQGQQKASQQEAKQQKLESALDSIRNRYGKDAVVRGSSLEKESE
ncbi:DNA polymerase IV [Bacteroidia bacterium]|nr:DNA polymerase IV [Bacteroidia bacterium]